MVAQRSQYLAALENKTVNGQNMVERKWRKNLHHFSKCIATVRKPRKHKQTKKHYWHTASLTQHGRNTKQQRIRQPFEDVWTQVISFATFSLSESYNIGDISYAHDHSETKRKMFVGRNISLQIEPAGLLKKHSARLLSDVIIFHRVHIVEKEYFSHATTLS